MPQIGWKVQHDVMPTDPEAPADAADDADIQEPEA